MADIVNLRQARKAKARSDKDKIAEANRAKFGRTKSERERTDMVSAQADKNLDLHKRYRKDED